MANWLTPFTRTAARTAQIDAERDRIEEESAPMRRLLDAEMAAIRARAGELQQILDDITHHRRGRND